MLRLHDPLQFVAASTQVVVFSFLALVLCARPAAAVTPNSPEVKALIERALSFLSSNNHDLVGGKCLVALAFKKNGRDANFVKIREAIAACQAKTFVGYSNCDNYNLALMVIFLIEMEDESYRPLVQRMLAELLKRQMPNGGWTYEGSPLGDTSQTQYGVLAMWIADRHNYDVPLPHIANAINFLVKTQDPSGGWGYHGKWPESNSRVEQTPLTMSLGSAALGSLYILRELVILPGEDPNASAGGPKEAPAKRYAALQAVGEKKAPLQVTRRRPVQGVDVGRLQGATRDGNAWLQKNFTVKPPEEWKHYAFYAYERYASFREVVEGGEPVEEPQWYNEMFAELQKTIHHNGSWEGGDTPVAATAFAVLVLSRSTQKAIKRAEALGEGILQGGMGLPPKVEDLKERNGRLVDAPLTGNIDDLLSILEDPDNPDVQAMADAKAVITLDADLSKRGGQITKLRAMVSHESYETRLVAVRSLSKARDLDSVPVLLYALSDPDIRVIREADKGLRFISRKLQGVVDYDPPTKEKLALLRARWREWYLSIRPDGQLLD